MLMRSKVAFVFGTRPEAIKLSPLIKLFKTRKEVDTEICSTGQHREMLDQILNVFEIRPEVDLDLMTHNQSLPDFLSNSVKKLDRYLEESSPDFLVVQGDTSTVLAAALSGFYHKVKVLHVEAGLRTQNLYSPFPEEMNRRLTTRLAFQHFAPTSQAKNNLLREGVEEANIFVTGNTSIDALLDVKSAIEAGKIKPNLDPGISGKLSALSRMILITGHRRENFGDGFLQICNAIRNLSIEFPDTLFLYPVHLNPNVKNVVYEQLGDLHNVALVAPQGYVEFIYLMMNSSIILTDSGGVQEEGPSLGKPILVMRDNTERPEGVEAGCSKLVGTSEARISSEIRRLLNDPVYYKSMELATNPYGDGLASKRILDIVLKTIGNN